MNKTLEHALKQKLAVNNRPTVGEVLDVMSDRSMYPLFFFNKDTLVIDSYKENVDVVEKVFKDIVDYSIIDSNDKAIIRLQFETLDDFRIAVVALRIAYPDNVAFALG